MEPRSASLLTGIKLGMAGLKKPTSKLDGKAKAKKGGKRTKKATWRPKGITSPLQEKTKQDGRDVTVYPPPEGFGGIIVELFTDPFMQQKVRVAMHDARKEAKDILTHGFELIEHPEIMAEFSYGDFLEGKHVDAYHERLCAFVKAKLGAKTVICYSHKLRLSPEVDYAAGKSGYARMIHADYSIPNALNNVQEALEGKGLPPWDPKAKGARCQIMNVWRNISETPIMNNSLATCDATSVAADDIGGIAAPTLQSTAHHRWCYFSRMERHEALLFMHWDSAWARHRPTFHSAFVDPTAPADAPHRESIESRLLIVY
jgi:hypothetical protein